MNEHNNYHTDIRWLTRSQLNAFYDSPDMFRRIFIDRSLPQPEPSKVAVIGQAIHSVFLEGRALEHTIVRIPDECLTVAGAINRKRLDEWIGDDARMPVQADEYTNIRACVESALHSPLMDELRDAHVVEPVVSALVDGCQIKARPDVLFTQKDKIIDVKTSAGITDRGFIRSARNYRYWLQDAHYSAAVATERDCDPLDIDFSFWTIETVAPYRVWCRRYDTMSRQMAHEEWREILRRYQACVESNKWEHTLSDTVSIRDWELRYQNQEVTWTDEAE